MAKVFRLKEITVEELVKAHFSWSLLGQFSNTVFVQCNKNGVHKPLKDIQMVWLPREVIERFSNGKPTQVFMIEKSNPRALKGKIQTKLDEVK